MITYLVTGAAGFIGSNFVKYITTKYANDIKVIVLDALTYAGNINSIKDELELPNVSFVKGDIKDYCVVKEIFDDNDIDFVVNFAAESHVDRSIENPKLFLETNILGTQNLLNCAREAWADGKDDTGKPAYKKGKKYLQISTDEVYGSLEKDFDEAQPLHVDDELKQVIEGRHDLTTFGKKFFTEDTPLSPRSPYSASKTSADMIAIAYHHTYNFPVNITRCSNNYGPYHFPEKLIPLVIHNILNGKKLPVYGKGLNVRDWLYVEDHCKAIDLIIHKGKIGEVYNVGGHNEMKNIDIVKLICQKLGKPESLITFVTDRKGHDMRYAIDPTKIHNELGWLPETKFADGIDKTIDWYLNNKSWWEDIISGEYQNYYEKMYGNR